MLLDHPISEKNNQFDMKDAILTAHERIRAFIRETPLDYSIYLSHLTGCQVYFKSENLQYTGSFKIRGALNKLLTLNMEQRSQGVITASSGNHGAAVAFGMNKLHIAGMVFVPENASKIKVENIRNYGVPIEFYGNDMMHTELFAMEYAKRHKMVYVSPYNDIDVICGQGTIATEIIAQMNQIDAVFIPVGGGGLISGIGSFLKTVHPHIQIIGCLPENSPVMAESIKSGHIIEMTTSETICDATAGGVDPHTMTLNLCQQYVDEYILVTENEIKNAILNVMQMQHQMIEGAAGVALAAFLKNADRFLNKNIIIILSGANISFETLKIILS